MDETSGEPGFLVALPLWAVRRGTGGLVFGVPEAGGPVFPVFSEELLAEQFIANVGLTGAVAFAVPREDTLAFLKTLKAAGCREAGFDPTGRPGQVPRMLPLDKLIEAARKQGETGGAP
jgi:hypothetical protein